MGGIGPPASSPALLLSVRHRDAGKNLSQGAARVKVPTRPIFFRLTFVAIPAGVRQDADRLSVVPYGYVVFSGQSAGRENPALSLERDFIDVVGPAAPGCLDPISRTMLRKNVAKSGGCTGKWFGRKFADAGSFKAESRVNHPLKDRNSEYFLSRAGCGERARPTLENDKFAGG